MKIHYFLAFFLLTIFTSNFNFTSAQTNLLCTFVNLDCNNDGIVDSVLNGGVPLVISIRLLALIIQLQIFPVTLVHYLEFRLVIILFLLIQIG